MSLFYLSFLNKTRVSHEFGVISCFVAKTSCKILDPVKSVLALYRHHLREIIFLVLSVEHSVTCVFKDG